MLSKGSLPPASSLDVALPQQGGKATADESCATNGLQVGDAAHPHGVHDGHKTDGEQVGNGSHGGTPDTNQSHKASVLSKS